jgi:hypothetical protein
LAGLSLTAATPARAFDIGAYVGDLEIASGKIVSTAGGELPVAEILHMETNHLVALGAGVLLGATVVSPYLEIGELTGVVLGVIAGDLIFRTGLMNTWPFQQKKGWF